MSSSMNNLNEYSKTIENVFNWMTKYMKHPQIQEQNIKLDISDVIVLLQCLGFTLHKYERTDNNNSDSSDLLKVDLACSKSGIRASMVKKLDECRCPENTLDIMFWNVSGCCPSSTQGTVIESTCSSLPKVPVPMRKIINAFLYKSLSIINNKDINENPDSAKQNLPLARYRSLDTLVVKRAEKTEQNWEIDPLMTPPSRTSSPISNVQAAMNEIKEQTSNSIESLKNIQKIIDLHLKKDEKNTTFSANTTCFRRVSDIAPDSNFILPSPMPTTTNVSKNRKLTSPKIKMSHEKKIFNSPLPKYNSLRYKSNLKSIEKNVGSPKRVLKPGTSSTSNLASYNSVRKFGPDTPRPLKFNEKADLKTKLCSSAKKTMQSTLRLTGAIPKRI